MGPQLYIVVYIKGILQIPRGVVLGYVESFEVIVVILYLRALRYAEPQTGKYIGHLFPHYGEGVKMSQAGPPSRSRDVDVLLI